MMTLPMTLGHSKQLKSLGIFNCRSCGVFKPGLRI